MIPRRALQLFSLLSLITILGASLAACTGQDTPTATKGSDSDPGASSRAVGTGETRTPGDTKGATRSSEAPRGTLRLLFDDPPTLDPHLAQDSTSAEFIVEIFSGLVALDQSLKIVPDLAESWEVGGDGTIYTFKLRQNAKFPTASR